MVRLVEPAERGLRGVEPAVHVADEAVVAATADDAGDVAVVHGARPDHPPPAQQRCHHRVHRAGAPPTARQQSHPRQRPVRRPEQGEQHSQRHEAADGEGDLQRGRGRREPGVRGQRERGRGAGAQGVGQVGEDPGDVRADVAGVAQHRRAVQGDDGGRGVRLERERAAAGWQQQRPQVDARARDLHSRGRADQPQAVERQRRRIGPRRHRGEQEAAGPGGRAADRRGEPDRLVRHEWQGDGRAVGGCPGVGDLGLAHRGEREREGGQRGQQPDGEHEPRPAHGASRPGGPAGRTPAAVARSPTDHKRLPLIDAVIPGAG